MNNYQIQGKLHATSACLSESIQPVGRLQFVTGMPTHWESSKRPLFVRTIVVDGNRHAILSEEDPLIQTNHPTCKPSRPGSGKSTESIAAGSSQEIGQEKAVNAGASLAKGGRKGHRDLQSCLIKLRLVLATQEKRKALNSAILNQCVRQENKKRKRLVNKNSGKRSCDWHAEAQQSNGEINDEQDETIDDQKACKYESDHNIAVATFFASETFIRDQVHHHNHSTTEGEINYNFNKEEKLAEDSGPTQIKGLSINSDFDIPWNSISADCYFTRPFYNRLSERVLQWIDHASKRNYKEKIEGSITNERKTETKSKITRVDSRSKKCLSQRDSSEDNYDEVRHEKDVDTILSRELPKFSEELNRLHRLKAEIPVKEETNAKQLQDSIAESFTNVVSIRSGKYALSPKIKQPEVQAAMEATSKRRSYLRRQQKLEESSDEEPDEISTTKGKEFLKGKIREICFPNDSKTSLDKNWSKLNQVPPLVQFSPQLPSKLSWLRDPKSGPHWPMDLATPKPQLHIFIPAINPENEASDSESCESLSY